MSTFAEASTMPLDGVRVAELTCTIAGSMAAMVLADYGADVVKVEPPEGSWLRGYPGFQMWNRGKKSVVIDLTGAAGTAMATRLIESCDVVIEDARPGGWGAGIDMADVCRRYPRLVHCRIEGFGSGKLDRIFPGYEGVIGGLSGRFQGLGELSGSAAEWAAERPVYVASPIGTFATAMLAAQGILGALLERERSDRGGVVTTSLLDGLAAATMRLAYRREGDRVVPAREDAIDNMISMGIALTFMTAECADGRYIQMCARTDAHFRNWLTATGLGHLIDDPRFAGAPLSFESVDDLIELRDRLRAAMRKQTQAEWMRIFIDECDVGADPILRFDEFLDHPQMVANGLVAEIEDSVLGRVKQVGRFVRLEGLAESPLRPAPALGANQDELTQAPAAVEKVAGVAGSPTPASLPFEGITVIELATFLAAPLGSALLAESGARVIKVEMPQGDTFRRVGLEFAHLAHGKESVAIDLKSAAGQAVLHRLVAGADVVLHNMRPGAVNRLGADYEALRAINPRLVYVYAASYGSRGPQAHRPAFHSTPHALSGGAVLQAGRGNIPVDDSYPDPCAGVAVAAAIALALYARARHGAGQYLETSMLCSTAYVHSNELVDYPNRPPRASVDPFQRGLHALYRLYPCSRGWLFVAALTDDEWAGLARSLGRSDWVDDPRFATAAARLKHDDDLTGRLDAIFAAKPAGEWQAELSGRGVAAVEADGQSFEQFLLDQGFVEPMSHRAFGEYFRIRPRLQFGGRRGRRAAPCALGEHSLAILAEFGYSQAERDAFLRDGVAVAAP